MDGYIAQLDKICDLADKYNAIVMVDDSHATGFFGKTGRGSIEHCDVMGRVDIITSQDQTPNAAWLKIVQTTKAKTRPTMPNTDGIKEMFIRSLFLKGAFYQIMR